MMMSDVLIKVMTMNPKREVVVEVRDLVHFLGAGEVDVSVEEQKGK
tara:strand:+ start:303 stop:440 length:138 start_codon:yes stop_codon:yes gene_type:complete